MLTGTILLTFIEMEEKVEYPKNMKHEGDNYSSELVVNDALKYIEENKEGPFFLHLALQIPHASLVAKEKYKAMYRGKVVEPKTKKPKRVHYTYEPEPKATFAGMVTYMDENVGLVLKKLKELGIDKNTLVIFSSDNGAMSEGGHKRENFNSSGILRGGKRDLYEGGIRVPTIAWWPETIKAGRISEHVSAFLGLRSNGFGVSRFAKKKRHGWYFPMLMSFMVKHRKNTITFTGNFMKEVVSRQYCGRTLKEFALTLRRRQISQLNFIT